MEGVQIFPVARYQLARLAGQLVFGCLHHEQLCIYQSLTDKPSNPSFSQTIKSKQKIQHFIQKMATALSFKFCYYSYMDSSYKKQRGLGFLSSFVLGGVASFIPETIGHILKHVASKFYPELWKAYFFSYPRYVKQYVLSQGLTFALYDYAKLKLIDRDTQQHSLIYFLFGGICGYLTTLLCYPMGYHQILLVNDILESGKMKKQGASKTKIFSYRMKRLYGGFGMAGTCSFIYRSIHFGLYDNFKHQTSSLGQKCVFALVSTQIAKIFSLIMPLKRQKALQNASQIDGWKKGYVRSLYNSIFSFRAFSRSASFIIYLLFKQVCSHNEEKGYSA